MSTKSEGGIPKQTPMFKLEMAKIQDPKPNDKVVFGHLKLEFEIYLGFEIWDLEFSFSKGERSLFQT